jgi:hypothetical protein
VILGAGLKASVASILAAYNVMSIATSGESSGGLQFNRRQSHARQIVFPGNAMRRDGSGCLGFLAIAIRRHQTETNGPFDQFAPNHACPFEPLEFFVNCGAFSMRVSVERTGDFVPAYLPALLTDQVKNRLTDFAWTLV